MKGPAGGISTQASVPGESAERPGGTMPPVAGLEGVAGAAPLVGGVGTVDGELNRGAAGLSEGWVEAGWGLKVGVGGLGVTLEGVGVASMGEAVLAGIGVEPAGGVAAGGVAAGGYLAGGVAAGMGVAVGDWVDTGGDGRKRSVLGASTPRGGVGMAGLAGEEDTNIGLWDLAAVGVEGLLVDPENP